MIIPSIDLMNGKAVQLKQGKEKILERKDVFELATEFRKYGDIAVIDLDAALGKGNNLALVKQLCSVAECRVGGGIRTKEKADEMLQAGAKKIIIGTKANKAFLSKLPKKRVIVALDSKNGRVVEEGWTKSSNKTPFQVISEIEDYCSEFLFTNVDKEGLMQGLDFKVVKELTASTKNKFTIAGGITSLKDVMQLEALGVNSQIGMALYTSKISLPEAFTTVIDFQKRGGIVPTIVQDEENQVLMLAYSSKESMEKTFSTGLCTFYSQSRNKLWTKGETSGNYQRLIKARYDCDKDAILLTVSQKGVACHTQQYSCFDEKKFTLEQVYQVIKDRINSPKPESYTSQIAASEKKIKEKLAEEANEVINYSSKENLVWELADLTYFALVLAAKNNVTLTDIKNELSKRLK